MTFIARPPTEIVHRFRLPLNSSVAERRARSLSQNGRSCGPSFQLALRLQVSGRCQPGLLEFAVRLLALQHFTAKHPGVPHDFLQAGRAKWDVIRPDQGERIPDLEPYDMLLVTGGPQNVWQEDKCPWLVSEKAAIRQFVVLMKRPYLGICLGHQLLAESIGGHVGLANAPEVGIVPVRRTLAGLVDALLKGFSDLFDVLQWHSSEVRSLPDGVAVLASSETCKYRRFDTESMPMGCSFTSESATKWFRKEGSFPHMRRRRSSRSGRASLRIWIDDLQKSGPHSIATYGACTRILFLSLRRIGNRGRRNWPVGL
jgi:GMP synthase-like glutamine amidotransferase